MSRQNRELVQFTMLNHIAHIKLPIILRVLYPALPVKQLNVHINEITKIVKIPKIYLQLNDEKFWTNLIAQNEPDKAKALKAYWLKIKPLAHMNTTALIAVYVDNIRSLIRYYEFCEQALNQTNPWWLPQTVREQKAALLGQIKRDIITVKKIKVAIQQAMLLRCNLYKQFNGTYYHDDALNQLCKQVNLLQKNSENVLPVQEESYISDDDRLTIYDLLQGEIEEHKLKTIITPIRKKRINTFLDKSIVIAKLKQSALFVYQTLKRIKNEQALRKLFLYKVNEHPLDFVVRWMVPIQAFLMALGMGKLFHGVFLLGAALLFASSFMLYGYLSQLLLPFLLILLTPSSVNTILSILFYTVALLPLWLYIATQYNSIKQIFAQYLYSDVNQHLIDSLIVLESSAYFIANRVSHAIVDVSHFDMKALVDSAESMQQRLGESLSSLEAVQSWKKRIIPQGLSQAIEDTKQKLIEQDKLIEARLQGLSAHIANEIGHEMMLLCHDLSNDKLTVQLPKIQISKLATLVNRYGSVSAKQEFKQNTNILMLWQKQIDVESLAHKAKKSTRHPWGTFALRKDMVNGWRILLNAFIEEETKKRIALRINDFLIGKGEYELVDLKADLLHLFPSCAELVLKNVQWLVYHTLTHRYAIHAKVLGQEQRYFIKEWYEQHQPLITKAQKVVSTLFAHGSCDIHVIEAIPEDLLAQYYEVLDAMEVYAYAHQKSPLIIRRENKVRVYLEQYQGDNPYAYRLLKFIPKSDKTRVICDIAMKRLQWILDNVEKLQNDFFHAIDSELFHNYRLLENISAFDFEMQVKTSRQFNEPSLNMEKFLQACFGHAFDNEGLVEKYRARHQTDKKPLSFKSTVHAQQREKMSLSQGKPMKLRV